MQSGTSINLDQPEIIIERVINHVQKVIIGKREAIEQVLIAFLCGGHVLLEDVPGVGKTMLVRALAKTIDCSYMRIQFTPDLLPSDITGINMYNPKIGEFEFRPGPIMSHIVLADEVNRSSPKTQSALLEAMEEHSVTIDGITHKLAAPFLLLATQNPLNYEGTYRLPEAQLDRFLLKIHLGYPQRNAEISMLSKLQDQHPIERLKPILFREELIDLQRQTRRIHVDESIKQYIVDLAAATRKHPEVMLGVSPRGSLALMRASQGFAMVNGRSYVIPDDIKRMLHTVFAHRMILNSDARVTGTSSHALLDQLLESVPVPSLRYASGN